jgi:HSP20 family protein
MRSRRPRSGGTKKEAEATTVEQQKAPEPEAAPTPPPPTERAPGLDLGTLRRQFEDLIDDFFGSGPTRRTQPRPAESEHSQVMPLNVIETAESIIIQAPLPGLQPGDIDISLRGQTLSLRAQRREPVQETGEYKRREWTYGPYHRTVELTSPVDADAARAAYRQGVVTLTLPKTDAAKTKTVAVEGDDAGAQPQPAAEPEQTVEPTPAPEPEQVVEPEPVKEPAGEETAPLVFGEPNSEAADIEVEVSESQED